MKPETKPVNLNQYRKAKARAEDKARADQNAVKFGRTKAQKLREAAKLEQVRKNLDQHEFE
jgi:anti-sigma28 factor (negative regulator of flagellin synthesis)